MIQTTAHPNQRYKLYPNFTFGKSQLAVGAFLLIFIMQVLILLDSRSRTDLKVAQNSGLFAHDDLSANLLDLKPNTYKVSDSKSNDFSKNLKSEKLVMNSLSTEPLFQPLLSQNLGTIQKKPHIQTASARFSHSTIISLSFTAFAFTGTCALFALFAGYIRSQVFDMFRIMSESIKSTDSKVDNLGIEKHIDNIKKDIENIETKIVNLVGNCPVLKNGDNNDSSTQTFNSLKEKLHLLMQNSSSIQSFMDNLPLSSASLHLRNRDSLISKNKSDIHLQAGMDSNNYMKKLSQRSDNANETKSGEYVHGNHNRSVFSDDIRNAKYSIHQHSEIPYSKYVSMRSNVRLGKYTRPRYDTRVSNDLSTIHNLKHSRISSPSAATHNQSPSFSESSPNINLGDDINYTSASSITTTNTSPNSIEVNLSENEPTSQKTDSQVSDKFSGTKGIHMKTILLIFYNSCKTVLTFFYT